MKVTVLRVMTKHPQIGVGRHVDKPSPANPPVESINPCRQTCLRRHRWVRCAAPAIIADHHNHRELIWESGFYAVALCNLLWLSNDNAPPIARATDVCAALASYGG